MKKNPNELKVALQGTLHELTKLSEQIKTTRDYSDQAELILCLRELISEQIEAPSCENTGHSAHAIR
jgi:hypothetical protein